MLRIASAVVSLLLSLATFAAAQPDLKVKTLAVQGDHFAINGEAKFLLFVSYFDAMRRSDLEEDFAYFKSKHIDGIRIFPNWWEYHCPTAIAANDTLFTSGTNLRAGRLDVLKNVLNRAKAHDLVVDISFSRETVPGLGGSNPLESDKENYEEQIRKVAVALKGDYGYPHVFFDLANEYEGNDLFNPDIVEIAATVRGADPRRILLASRGSGADDALEEGKIVKLAGLDVAGIHPPREPEVDWYKSNVISGAIAAARTGMGSSPNGIPSPYRPVYLQEPMPFANFDEPTCTSNDIDEDPNHHWAAVQYAKQNRAAAYTFHTRQSFNLATNSLVDILNADHPTQKQTLDQLWTKANEVGWVPLAPLRFTGADWNQNQDFRADLPVWRPSYGEWWIRLNPSSPTADPPGPSDQLGAQWGLNGDIPVPGDYDGDGRADLGVWRPSNSTWYVNNSSGNYSPTPANVLTYQWGLNGDVPVPADYDGDARADLAVFRPSNGNWYVRFSSTGFATTTTYQWGLPGDMPFPGDYDGDRRADLVVWRPSEATWYMKFSTGEYTLSKIRPFGFVGDIPVPGDYDGDRKFDLAVVRPSEWNWYRVHATVDWVWQNGYVWTQWGLTNDVAVPADINGDGTQDFVVWRPSEANWYIRYSTGSSPPVRQWGLGSDTPLPGNGQPVTVQ